MGMRAARCARLWRKVTRWLSAGSQRNGTSGDTYLPAQQSTADKDILIHWLKARKLFTDDAVSLNLRLFNQATNGKKNKHPKTSQWWHMDRSSLLVSARGSERRGFMYWKPAQDALRRSRRPYVGPNKTRSSEHQCAECKSGSNEKMSTSTTSRQPHPYAAKPTWFHFCVG